MKEARLRRFAYLKQAVVGRLTVGPFSCWTLERPWENNVRMISCIPDGTYVCEPFSGKKFKDVIEVTGVPNRSYILFHAANYPEELEGCIAPGLHHAINEDHARVWESLPALEQLKSAAGQSFSLSVSSAAARLNTNPEASPT